LVNNAGTNPAYGPAASRRDTRPPAAPVIDFDALPGHAPPPTAGLLLTVPDLIALDLPALAAAAG
jgi:hypothetical protein